MKRHATTSRHELRATIDALGPWFHNVHLPDGTQTAPGHRFGDFPGFKWRKIEHAVPDDLHGWSVLDIGCNAGFYSIELARRGADVLGIDVEPLYLEQARWVAQQCGLQRQVQFMLADVYDLIWQRRTFDLVWFTGVFYHLRYPLLALDLVRRVTGRLLMFQAMTMPGEASIEVPRDLPLEQRDAMLQEGWPKMAFIEHRVAGDATNWWAPSHACVEALLRSSGFRVVDRPEHEFYVCSVAAGTAPADLQRLLRTIET
ncbi:MAG TPA: TIGR04290 family methyltransferase [Steroidobacteraceae bacterium]|nr:TIGR04290 family methyltransferase [Steroidobacteraceae bacterium]